MTELGDRVRDLREAKGMGASELAQAAGVSKSYISTLENGGHPRPGLHAIRSIAAALDVTLGELVGEKPMRQGPMMDRPAYELVRLLEAELDDADQTIDSPMRPNNISVWGLRMYLEPYGGKPHRWQWPKCFECDHQLPLHNYGPCDLCGCAITSQEISDGARDEALDEAVMQALRYEREHRG